MAINRIENITIDNDNKVFGGYIYSIDYSFGLGAETSSVNVTLFSETGDYFISPEDLKTSGSPTEIRIGNNLLFYGYPIAYKFEKSSSGKLLVVEYVDESIAYLDTRRIELKGRIGSTPSIRVTQDGRQIISSSVSPRIILLGQPFYTKQLIGRNVRVNLTEEAAAGTQVHIYPDYVTLESSSLLTLEDYAEVPEVLYNFVELLDALQDIIETRPTLTSDHYNYYRNYTGTIRETLSQWSSDLGLIFYWRNRKLHFIDVRNPETFTVIKQNVDNLLTTLKPERIEDSFTLRGTAARAVTSQFLKNGQVVNDGEVNGVRSKTFLRLRIDNIINLRNYFNATSLLNEPWLSYIKAAKFSPELMILNLCKRANSSGYTYFPPGREPSDCALACLKMINTGDDSSYYTYLKEQADEYFGANFEYVFFKIYQNETLLVGSSTSIREKYFSIFQAISTYMNRFKYHRIGKIEYEKASFDKTDIVWYHRGVSLKETSIGKVLEPLKDIITNYDRITLEGFIYENPSNLYDENYMNSTNKDLDGFAIMEEEPFWQPGSQDEIFDARRIFLHEPTSDSSNLESKVIYLGIALGADDSLLSEVTDAEALSSINIEGIENPFESDRRQTYTYRRQTWPYVEGKYEFIKTNYCSDYDTANVERVDMDIVSIPEELIISQNSSNEITLPSFEAAHAMYSQPLLFSQTQPFFTKSISLPYISLDIDLSPENGFQSVSIRYGNDGITADYTFGTEKMILPNPEFYLATFYDTAAKKVRSYFKQKQILPRGYKIIY